jgi:DNA-directed RNA polymerase subunit M/transcription elongation factor TFIIS
MTDTISRRFRGLSLLAKIMGGAQAVHLEHAVAAQTSVVYEDKIRQMYWNVKRVPGLMDQYSPGQLVCLDNATMARDTDVERWEQAFRIKLQTEEDLYNRAPVSTLSLMRCRKCKSQNIATVQVQTRGADEAMTIFNDCGNCGTRWKS